MTGSIPPASEKRSPRTRRRGRALLIRRIIAFAAAAAIGLVLAFNGGGYDAAFRQEAGIALWGVIAVGLAFGALPRGRPPAIAAAPVVALLALVLLTVLSLSWSDSDERTYEELTRLIAYGGLVALAYLGLNRHTWRAAAGGVTFAALIVPLFSVLSRLVPDAFPAEAIQAIGPDRLSYPFEYWNAVACWSAMAAAIGLTWSAHARRIELRALLLAAVPVAGLAVYLSGSRAGVIAVGVAVGAAVLLSRNRWTVSVHALAAGAGTALAIGVANGQPEIDQATGSAGGGKVVLALLAAVALCAVVATLGERLGLDRVRLPRQAGRIAIPVGIVVVLLAVGVAGGNRIETAWDEFSNEETTPVGDTSTRLGSFGGNRHDAWTSAIDAFESDRLRGIGAGGFEFWWARESDDPEFFRDAHSLYLEVLAELGFAGFLALIGFVAGLLGVALAVRSGIARTNDLGAHAAMTAAFLVWIVYVGIDWMWEVTAIGALGVMAIAIAGTAQSRRFGRGPMPMGMRGLAVAVALLFVAIQVPSLVSIERLRASSDQLEAGRIADAKELADDSVSAEPWAASPYAQRALVSEAEGRLDDAEEDLDEAVEREPTNWRHRLLLARIAARRGDRTEMQNQIAAARRLWPKSPFLVPNSAFFEELDELLAQAPPAGRGR